MGAGLALGTGLGEGVTTTAATIGGAIGLGLELGNGLGAGLGAGLAIGIGLAEDVNVGAGAGVIVGVAIDTDVSVAPRPVAAPAPSLGACSTIGFTAVGLGFTGAGLTAGIGLAVGAGVGATLASGATLGAGLFAAAFKWLPFVAPAIPLIPATAQKNRAKVTRVTLCPGLGFPTDSPYYPPLSLGFTQ